MARTNRRTNPNQQSMNSQNTVPVYAVNDELGVSHVREWQDNNITFALHYLRMTVYGCRIMTGEHGEFVSMPSKKIIRDGAEKWLNHVYIKLTDQEQQDLIEMVYRIADANAEQKH